MNLREATDQQGWDAWASSVPHATFLQSWAWGEGQTALGKEVKRFVIEEEGEIVFIAQAIKESRKGLAYWFVPGGPVAVGHAQSSELRAQNWANVIDLLKKELLQGLAVFLRIEPLILLDLDDLRSTIRDLRDCVAVKSFNPAIRWMVHLEGKTAEQVLHGMESKTRYNVRLGEKQGVTTRLSTSEKDFEKFLTLTHEMATRNKIVVHSDQYLRETFFAMAKRGIAQLRLAEYEGAVLAASIEVSFGDTVTYLHGASTSSSREVKAPNVLQWQAIQAAMRDGYAWYDFGGCNPSDKAHLLYKTSLEGVTRFKEGWGGGRIETVGTFVVPRYGILGRFFKR